jgi:hypothetical protein
MIPKVVCTSTQCLTFLWSFIDFRSVVAEKCVGGGGPGELLAEERKKKKNNNKKRVLKLKTHFGFHDLFRFWYVQEYKYGSILWLEEGNLYLHLPNQSLEHIRK